jgi:hypothetical protein
LLVVLFVWTGFPGRGSGALASAARIYQNVAGCFRDYAFFAPSVATPLKAAFLLTGGQEKAEVVTFTSSNREVAFRFDCLVAACMKEERGRDLFAQSWAALMLGSHPRAQTATVVVKSLDLPTMAESRAGKPPVWKIVYAGEFARRQRSPA